MKISGLRFVWPLPISLYPVYPRVWMRWSETGEFGCPVANVKESPLPGLYQGSRSLLLLDEATSSIDTETERRIQEVLNKLRGELTMVIITHRPSTIRRADRIVVLDNGRVVDRGQLA